MDFRLPRENSACGLAEAINRNDAALLAEATDLGAHRLLRQRFGPCFFAEMGMGQN